MSETSCREVDSDPESDDDANQELIRTSREVVRHRSETETGLHHRPRPSCCPSLSSSNKRGRTLPLPEEPPKEECRRRRWKRRGRGKANGRHANDKQTFSTTVNVSDLRYSQESVKQHFCCGRPVASLVQDLVSGNITMSARFLRLAVFETLDEYTDEVILRCIDNRRLFAVKEYSKIIGKDVPVHVRFYNHETISEFYRFMRNSDPTDGRDVRLRKGNDGNGRVHRNRKTR